MSITPQMLLPERKARFKPFDDHLHHRLEHLRATSTRRGRPRAIPCRELRPAGSECVSRFEM